MLSTAASTVQIGAHPWLQQNMPATAVPQQQVLAHFATVRTEATAKKQM
jgi:hypothetical protein